MKREYLNWVSYDIEVLVMIFIFMNLVATTYAFLLTISKELNMFTLCNNFFLFTNDFDSSGDRVMKFPASGHRSFLIDVSGKCKYMH